MTHPVRVRTATGWLDLTVPGPEGPPGPAGPAGEAPEPFIFTQGTPSATWVILHNLNRYPSVMVVDSGNTVIDPDIHYDDATQITINFGAPTSGKAYLS